MRWLVLLFLVIGCSSPPLSPHHVHFAALAGDCGIPDNFFFDFGDMRIVSEVYYDDYITTIRPLELFEGDYDVVVFGVVDGGVISSSRVSFHIDSDMYITLIFECY